MTAGATGALGNISMTGYDSADLSGMMEKVTAGATGALGKISMTGYDSSDLTGMMEKVTAGATGALGNISDDRLLFRQSHLNGGKSDLRSNGSPGQHFYDRVFLGQPRPRWWRK